MRSKVILFIIFISIPAQASDWLPGGDPYTGTLDNATIDMINAGVPYIAITHLAHKAKSNECTQRRLLPGERIDIMESGHGLMYNVIVPSEPADMWAIDCASRYGHLLKPHVCDNWSFQYPVGTIPTHIPTWLPSPWADTPQWLIGPWLSSDSWLQSDTSENVVENVIDQNASYPCPNCISTDTTSVPSPAGWISICLAFAAIVYILFTFRRVQR